MVWFQCEDCGENLKKPKLINHFRRCSAQQLSCIDCGVVFNQQSVQRHTQCVSEAEKYGPKTIGCYNKEIVKTHKEPNCEGMDVSLGLSTRAPWNCSLCTVKATSQETLMLHAEGKKHKSKVRALSSKHLTGDLLSNDELGATVTVLSADQKREMTEHTCIVPSNTGSNEKSNQNSETKGDFSAKPLVQLDNGPKQQKESDSNIHVKPRAALSEGNNGEQTERHQKRRKVDVEQNTLPSSVRRKAEESCNQTEASFSKIEPKVELERRSKIKQKKHLIGEDAVKKWSSVVKWKKIIKRTLKNAPSGSLKKKRLCRSLLPAVLEVTQKFGFEVSKETFLRELEKQIDSYAMFTIDGKMVRLAVEDVQKECTGV